MNDDWRRGRSEPWAQRNAGPLGGMRAQVFHHMSGRKPAVISEQGRKLQDFPIETTARPWSR
jgi:hypothetical protein